MLGIPTYIDWIDGEIVMDSRDVAKRMGITHKQMLYRIRKYRVSIQQNFGQYREAKEKSPRGGRNFKYFKLTKQQVAILILFSNKEELKKELAECVFSQ